MDSEELQFSFGGPSKDASDRATRRLQRLNSSIAALEAPQNTFERVKEFHQAFGHPISDKPVEVKDERLTLRLSLILEEAMELADAMGFSTADTKDSIDYMLNQIGPRVYEDHIDIVGVADALGDLDYVINGAAVEMGIPLPAVAEEVHRSNMTKLGADGKPIYREDGKILKGENYEPPQIKKVLFG